MLTLITAASAEQLSPLAQMTNPPHIEFKYYGFYSVIDYTFMTNLNKVHGEYIDDYVLNGILTMPRALSLRFRYSLSSAVISFATV